MDMFFVLLLLLAAVGAAFGGGLPGKANEEDNSEIPECDLAEAIAQDHCDPYWDHPNDDT